MNTEERHHLQQNDLAVHTAKAKTFAEEHGFTLLLVAAAIVVLLVAASLWTSWSRSASALGWADLFEARDQAELADVAVTYPDTPAALWAELIEADYHTRTGVAALYTDRATADDELKLAREKYEAVLDRDPPAQAAQKALFGLATVQEVTSGGELTPALETYGRLIDEYPDSPFTALAERRVEELERPAAKPFYTWLAEQEPKPSDLQRPIDGPELPETLPERPAGLRRIEEGASGTAAPAETTEVPTEEQAPADDADTP